MSSNKEVNEVYRRIKSLPCLEDLLILKKKDPEGLHKAAVKLRVDREQLENDVLIPVRLAVAESIIVREELLNKDPDVNVVDEAIWGLLKQLARVELSLLNYESRETLETMGLGPNN